MSKTSATFQFKKRGEDTKTYMLTPGDSLSVIDTAFEGITISAIGKNYIELTNGQTKFQGEEFNTDIYSCLLYTSPSPRDLSTSRMPSSA